jgi:hypothetical protein
MGNGTFWIAYSGHYNNLGFGMANFSVTALTCSSDAECDDGLACNGVETCVDSMCQPGTPVVCPDNSDPCDGSEFCSEVVGGCSHTGDPCGAGTSCVKEGPEDYRCEPETCGNGSCDAGEDCTNCPGDCISGSGGGGDCSDCFKGVCDGNCHPRKDGPNCPDCAPTWCCGDGVCEGEENSGNCAIDCGAPPECGDGNCDAGEDPCSCPDDCGAPSPTETYCSDGVDNDCDGDVDCDDADCAGDPGCDCFEKKATCVSDADCCSNRCSRKGVCL